MMMKFFDFAVVAVVHEATVHSTDTKSSYPDDMPKVVDFVVLVTRMRLLVEGVEEDVKVGCCWR